MAKVILVGGDVALLEGLAQTLLGFGHDVSFATTIDEMGNTKIGEPPEIAVVSCDALRAAGAGVSLPLTAGGALLVYGTCPADRPLLPTKLQRATLAYLVLPLERQRLIALVQSFENRSRTTGRSLRDDEIEETDLRA